MYVCMYVCTYDGMHVCMYVSMYVGGSKTHRAKEKDKEKVTGSQALPSAWVRIKFLSTGIEGRRERDRERDRERKRTRERDR